MTPSVLIVAPAKAGGQGLPGQTFQALDARFRGNDD